MNRLSFSRFTVSLLSLVNVLSTLENVVTPRSKNAFFKVPFSCLNLLVSWFSRCEHRLFMRLDIISFTRVKIAEAVA